MDLGGFGNCGVRFYSGGTYTLPMRFIMIIQDTDADTTKPSYFYADIDKSGNVTFSI